MSNILKDLVRKALIEADTENRYACNGKNCYKSKGGQFYSLADCKKECPYPEADKMKEQKRPDYPDIDGDGDRKEPMAKAFKDKKAKGKKSLKKEAEITADNTKFSVKVDVSNKQSETKLGIRIQLTPKGDILEPDVRDKLEAAIMKKLNNSLEKFDIQVSKDTDVPNPEVLGFFIPLSHIKNMIITSIKGSPSATTPTSPVPPPPPPSSPPSSMTEPIDEMINRMIDDELITEMRQRTLNEISQIVMREDFYGFVNAGNNMLRSLEERGYDIRDSKKYLKYLVAHNIM